MPPCNDLGTCLGSGKKHWTRHLESPLLHHNRDNNEKATAGSEHGKTIVAIAVQMHAHLLCVAPLTRIHSLTHKRLFFFSTELRGQTDWGCDELGQHKGLVPNGEILCSILIAWQHIQHKRKVHGREAPIPGTKDRCNYKAAVKRPHKHEHNGGDAHDPRC